jgi:hypothetical protein
MEQKQQIEPAATENEPSSLRVLQLLCLIAQSLGRIEAQLAQITGVAQPQPRQNGKLIAFPLGGQRR